MKTKVLNGLLILFSFVGYLEWGKDQAMFLVEGEWDVLIKLFTSPTEILHPFIILPLIGQILLMVTLFQKQPSRALTIAGLAGIGVLLIFVFFIGIISRNDRILFSTLPFLVTAILVMRHLRVKKRANQPGHL